MKSFLILILLSRIDISMPIRYLNTNSESPTLDSQELDARRYVFPRHRFNTGINRGYYNIDSDLRQRYLHPHRYRYIYSSRKQNPVFNKQLSVERRDEDPNKNLLPKRYFDHPSGSFSQTRRNASSPSDFLFKSQKLRKRKDRLPDTLNEFADAGQSSQTKSGTKRNSPTSLVDSKNFVNDNRGTSDSLNSGLKDDNTSADLVDQSPREVPKAKQASLSPVKRLYRSLGRFDLLYILGLFLLFIPVASCIIFILPLASLCFKNPFKRRPTKAAAKGSSDEIIVETALGNEQPGKAKIDSLEEMQKNFVSNEINGDGDTVGKRMKLERWMTQGFQHRSRSRPRFLRHFNSPDMERVDEEHSGVDESMPGPAYAGSNPDDDYSQSESEGLAEIKASRQASEPFQLARNKCITIGRVHNPRSTNPRHMFSLVDNSNNKRLPRSSISMLDIPPKHSSKQ